MATARLRLEDGRELEMPGATFIWAAAMRMAEALDVSLDAVQVGRHDVPMRFHLVNKGRLIPDDDIAAQHDGEVVDIIGEER